MAMALAPSSTARSASSLPAYRANSGVWIGTPSGATLIMGWIEGAR